jgi:predicted cupin superfamily sugar epimerase
MNGCDRITSARDIIEALSLKPHPEGGHYRETFRDARTVNGRAISTAIYYLLQKGERSHWHRIDATEIWHWYGGASLALSVKTPEGPRIHRLGIDLSAGEAPQAIVPAGMWQSAEPLGEWALVGCTVAPGFEFSTFEMAPEDWRP